MWNRALQHHRQDRGKEYPEPSKQAKGTREQQAKTRPLKKRPKEKIRGT